MILSNDPVKAYSFMLQTFFDVTYKSVGYI